jgi:hypothetical protein
MMGGSERWGMDWGISGFGWFGVIAVCVIVVGIAFFALRRRNS